MFRTAPTWRGFLQAGMRWGNRKLARPRKRRRPDRAHLSIELLEGRNLLSASLFGSVWNDLDADGLRDATESGLAGVTVFLDANNNGVFDSTVRTIDADSTTLVPGPLGQGDFVSNLTVTGLPQTVSDLNLHLDVSKSNPGNILVGLLTPLGRAVGTGATLFFLGQGQSFIGTFDDQAAQSIAGASSPFLGDFRPQEAFTLPHAHVYDGDPNGVWQLIFFGDVSGITLNSWSLTFTVPETNAQTGSDGAYSFTGLDPGTYAVAADLPPAAVQTFPAGSHVVQLTDNQTATGVDFGIKPAADLVGTAFTISGTPDWGQPVTVLYTLTNQGAGDAGPFDVELRLAGDGLIDGNDLLLGTISIAGLAGFTSISGSVQVTLPGSPGSPPASFASVPSEDVLLGFRLDVAGNVLEGNESNNANRGAGADFAFLFPQPNQAITSDGAVQQMPSIAVNPLNPNHLVMAYMDYALVTTGYAGLGVAASLDGGRTWQYSDIPLPAGFAQGAANPTVQFDGQGKVFVSFMAATFPGSPENIQLRGGAASAPELVIGQKPSLTYPFDPLGGTAAGDERALGLMANNGIFVARSNDGGFTFNASDISAVTSNLFTYTGNLPADKVFFDTSPDIAIDTFAQLPDGSANPNFGNLYAVWTRLYPRGRFPGVGGTGGGEIYLAVSTDGGQTWQTKLRADGNTVLRDPSLSDAPSANLAEGSSFSIDPRITIGPEGDLYVSHFAGGAFAVYRSTNGGASFTLPDRSILQLQLPFGSTNTSRPPRTLDGYSFRTFPVRQIVADPARPGHVYALEAIRVFNQFTGLQIDAAELNFAVSTDHGLTWTRVFTVGDNPSNIDEVAPAFRGGFRSTLNDDDLGRFLRFDQTLGDEVITGQALPKLTIDAQGNLAVIWYDTRRTGDGHLLDVFGTVSTDGGQTWRANYRVTDVSFDANDGAFTDAAGRQTFFIGDVIGVAAAGGRVYAAWTDARHGNQDVFFAQYLLTPAAAPPTDRFEDNQTPATATPLGRVTLPRTLPRLVIDARDEDWFQVQTAATGDLIVAVSAAQNGQTLGVELWDSTGSTLLAVGVNLLDDAGNVIGKKLTFASAADQTFLVRVTGTAIDPVSYALTAQSLTADLGTRVQGAVAGSVTAGGRAVYQLTPGLTGTLELVVKGGSNIQGILDIEVLAADGVTILAAGYVEPNKTQTLILPVEAGKTLLIQVFGKTRALLPVGTGSFNLDFTNHDQFTFPNDAQLVHAREIGSLATGTASLVIPFTAQATGVIEATIGTLGTIRRTMKLEILGADGSTVLATGTVNTKVTVAVEKGQLVHFRVSGTPFNPPPANLLQNFFLEYANLFDASVTGKAVLFHPAGGFPSTVAIADLNGDGHDDLVTSSTRFSDPISVLLSNGDGTFQAPRQFAVGAGLNTSSNRELVVADFSGDRIPDIAVANPLSSDVSLLIGRGDGSFEPHRRFDTTFQASMLGTGDFNEDGIADLVAGQNSLASNNLSILLGRGDGTFLPQTRFASAFTEGQVALRVGDFNNDFKDDLAVFSRGTGKVQILLGNGDGTFTQSGIFTTGSVAVAAQVGDVNGDGEVDIVTGDLNTPTVFVLFGNGDGTFQGFTPFLAGVDGVRRGVFNLTLADFGRQTTLADGSTVFGAPDGKMDIIVSMAPRIGTAQAQVVVLHGLVNGAGAFESFGTPRLLADARLAGPLAAGDLDGDGVIDIAASDFGGVRVIYNNPPVLPANTSPATARDLGTVVHLMQPTEGIVRGEDHAFFTLTVPSEAVSGAGDQVLDFSASFQFQEGAGLRMEVLDAGGNVLASGERFRLLAPQGDVLTVHVFGVLDSLGVAGAGVFTLIVDVLPQVVGIEAQSILPGAPATSLVLTLQGDRLDPATAENAAHYRVTWLGPDGLAGTADDQVISLATSGPAVVYNPGANVQVSSGRTYPTAVRQTITLSFDQPLPVGNYRIELSPAIQTAFLNDEEQAALAGAGHVLVSAVAGQIIDGSRFDVTNLVTPPSSLDLNAITAGTSFLTQLQNDLGAVLDAQLLQVGDAPSITTLLTDVIQSRLEAGNGSNGSLTSFLIIWLDPVSIDLADSRGSRTVYNLQTNAVSNSMPRTFVEVGGNVELVVMAGAVGNFTLNVADVPPSARGGALVFSNAGTQVTLLTNALRSGVTSFQFTVPALVAGTSGFVFNVNDLSALLTLINVGPQNLTALGDGGAGDSATGTGTPGALSAFLVLTTTGVYGSDYGVAEAAEGQVLHQVLSSVLGEPLSNVLFQVVIGVGESLRSMAGVAQQVAQQWLDALPDAQQPQGKLNEQNEGLINWATHWATNWATNCLTAAAGGMATPTGCAAFRLAIASPARLPTGGSPVETGAGVGPMGQADPEPQARNRAIEEAILWFNDQLGDELGDELPPPPVEMQPVAVAQSVRIDAALAAAIFALGLYHSWSDGRLRRKRPVLS